MPRDVSDDFPTENSPGVNVNCTDAVFMSLNLVDVQSVDSTILVDLKYASDDNFMQRQLYFTITKLYLQKDVAQRLAACQQYLQSIHPGYRLLVYDGVRPVEVQQRMWDALDTIPVAQRGKFVSNPKNHSVHNYGAAVDVTIVDEYKQPLDMGAGYDDIRKIAYPSMENEFLASGELQPHQVENRKLLRKVMRNQGFINIPSEWWHFNAYSRNEVKRRYKVVEKEPDCE
ncbi:M15 family metallopeptidase [Crocinitomicaceae bacterium CZZ-1]|uniref:D-alanyl-D-alanine dipeptidase n=1 Tax=Taishania pollutisoli TaxID=2766479 RepID=A0A8J6PDM2_9FLAO|nr:M15 family metallopeptidase [Taishania pollutisoli]MBC9811495.1 M15 family metallopeptidase [Taishania pollutisoli]